MAGQSPFEGTRFGVDGVVSPGLTGTTGPGGGKLVSCGGSRGGCGGPGGVTSTPGVFGTATTPPPLFGTC